MGKRELMENFDDWVTDPHITLAGLKQDLLDDPSRIGGLYRGQYLVVTTSGSTGEPAVLVQDRTSLLVASFLLSSMAPLKGPSMSTESKTCPDASTGMLFSVVRKAPIAS